MHPAARLLALVLLFYAFVACEKNSQPVSSAPPKAVELKPKSAVAIAKPVVLTPQLPLDKVKDESTKKSIQNQFDELLSIIDRGSAPDSLQLDKMFAANVVISGRPDATQRIAALLSAGITSDFHSAMTDAERKLAFVKRINAMTNLKHDDRNPEGTAEAQQQSSDNAALEIKIPAEEIYDKAKQIIEHQLSSPDDVDTQMRAIADALQKALPDLSSWDAKKTVYDALHTNARPESARYAARFKREPALLVQGAIPPCPKGDSNYLVAKKSAYWDDANWIKLYAKKDAELPAGGLLETVKLLTVDMAPIGVIYREGYRETPENFADKLLVRYGAQGISCLIYALAHTNEFAADDAEKYRLFKSAFQVAAKAPPEVAQPLIEAAIESGWTEWEKIIPSKPSFDALRKKSETSPYGRWFQN